jgi:hypothetical protein
MFVLQPPTSALIAPFAAGLPIGSPRSGEAASQASKTPAVPSKARPELVKS